MASRIVTLFLLTISIIISGCNFAYVPPVVQAQSPHATQIDPNETFQGRYIFHSRGVGNMSEVGFIIADGKGHFTLHSMYISDTQNNGVNTAGHYSLTSALAGTANQGSCAMSTPVCIPGDVEALFVSSDGQHATMVSMEGPGAGWSLDMERDNGISVGDLSTCDATSGTILNCNDGWVIPPNWK